MTFFFGDTERRIAWKDGDWYFADTQRYLGQIQQKSEGDPGSGETLTFLRKAEIDEMIEHARKHCTVATVEEAATILRLNPETIYRMVDRADLDRVPGIRHVRIPLNQIIALSQGRKKDGSPV